MGSNGKGKILKPGKVRVAWVELDAKTGDTTLFVEGVVDPVGFAKLLTDLAVEYATQRAVEAARIERATLEQVGAVALSRSER